MTNQEVENRVKEIQDRANAEMQSLFDEVLLERTYPDGCRVRRIRHNDDGTVYDDITGTVVGARIALIGWTASKHGPCIDGYPAVHYSVRVDSPSGYNSRQSSQYFPEIPAGKYEDFWQGDQRWSGCLLVNIVGEYAPASQPQRTEPTG